MCVCLCARVSVCVCQFGCNASHSPVSMQIQKKTIAVRISDSRYGSAIPKSQTWERDPETGTWVIVMRSHQIESHHQYAIILDLPPYHNQSITVCVFSSLFSLFLILSLSQSSVVVWIQLIDESDETASAPAAFEYVPSSTSIHQATKFMRASTLSNDWSKLAQKPSPVPSSASNMTQQTQAQLLMHSQSHPFQGSPRASMPPPLIHAPQHFTAPPQLKQQQPALSSQPRSSKYV